MRCAGYGSIGGAREWSIEMANKLALKSFRLKNFKAIRDSGVVKFTPLTVLIGDNGSGKSSLVEGLQTYQKIVTDGLDEAMNEWRGYENIRNAAVTHTDKILAEGKSFQTNPIVFQPSYRITKSDHPLFTEEQQSHLLTVTASPNDDEIFILEERLIIGGKKNLSRNKEGVILAPGGKRFGYGPKTNRRRILHQTIFDTEPEHIVMLTL